jgi:hypothetical protein
MRFAKCLYMALALCIASVASYAQKGTTILEFDGGVSLPLGNFGKASTATSLVSTNGTIGDNSGYAKMGGYFSVDGAWFFSKYFGIGGMFKYGTYSLKNIDSLSYGYEESFDVDTTRTNVTSYKVWSIMPGLYFNMPLAKKIAIDARALVGIASASTPQIYVGIEDGQVIDPPVIQYSASKVGFAADLGVGLRYYLYRGVSINVKADYFYTKPDFTISNSKRNTNAGREIYSYNQPLESVNFSAGLAYTLWCKHK